MEKHLSEYAMYGIAIDNIRIDEDGAMWVDNDEYCSRVNFCPWTGKPAPKQMDIIRTGIGYGNTPYTEWG